MSMNDEVILPLTTTLSDRYIVTETWAEIQKPQPGEIFANMRINELLYGQLYKINPKSKIVFKDSIIMESNAVAGLLKHMVISSSKEDQRYIQLHSLIEKQRLSGKNILEMADLEFEIEAMETQRMETLREIGKVHEEQYGVTACMYSDVFHALMYMLKNRLETKRKFTASLQTAWFRVYWSVAHAMLDWNKQKKRKFYRNQKKLWDRTKQKFSGPEANQNILNSSIDIKVTSPAVSVPPQSDDRAQCDCKQMCDCDMYLCDNYLQPNDPDNCGSSSDIDDDDDDIIIPNTSSIYSYDNFIVRTCPCLFCNFIRASSLTYEEQNLFRQMNPCSASSFCDLEVCCVPVAKPQCMCSSCLHCPPDCPCADDSSYIHQPTTLSIVNAMAKMSIKQGKFPNRRRFTDGELRNLSDKKTNELLSSERRKVQSATQPPQSSVPSPQSVSSLVSRKSFKKNKNKNTSISSNKEKYSGSARSSKGTSLANSNRSSSSSNQSKLSGSDRSGSISPRALGSFSFGDTRKYGSFKSNDTNKWGENLDSFSNSKKNDSNSNSNNISNSNSNGNNGNNNSDNTDNNDVTHGQLKSEGLFPGQNKLVKGKSDSKLHTSSKYHLKDEPLLQGQQSPTTTESGFFRTLRTGRSGSGSRSGSMSRKKRHNTLPIRPGRRSSKKDIDDVNVENLHNNDGNNNNVITDSATNSSLENMNISSPFLYYQKDGSVIEQNPNVTHYQALSDGSRSGSQSVNSSPVTSKKTSNRLIRKTSTPVLPTSLDRKQSVINGEDYVTSHPKLERKKSLPKLFSRSRSPSSEKIQIKSPIDYSPPSKPSKPGRHASSPEVAVRGIFCEPSESTTTNSDKSPPTKSRESFTKMGRESFSSKLRKKSSPIQSPTFPLSDVPLTSSSNSSLSIAFCEDSIPVRGRSNSSSSISSNEHPSMRFGSLPTSPTRSISSARSVSPPMFRMTRQPMSITARSKSPLPSRPQQQKSASVSSSPVTTRSAAPTFPLPPAPVNLWETEIKNEVENVQGSHQKQTFSFSQPKKPSLSESPSQSISSLPMVS